MESKRPEGTCFVWIRSSFFLFWLDSAFKQQKLEDLQPRMNINHQVLIYLIIGILFLPIGFYLRSDSSDITEYKIQYDGDGSDVSSCKISSSNEGKECSVSISLFYVICLMLFFQLTFTFNEDATGPFYVYYQVENFYQNHRRYVKSRSADQLMGEVSVHILRCHN